MKRPKGSEGTAVTPVPAYMEGTDAPYASTARIALIFSTRHSIPHSSFGPPFIHTSPIHPLVIHSSIGPPFIHRESSFTERDWGFVRGRP